MFKCAGSYNIFIKVLNMYYNIRSTREAQKTTVEDLKKGQLEVNSLDKKKMTPSKAEGIIRLCGDH